MYLWDLLDAGPRVAVCPLALKADDMNKKVLRATGVSSYTIRYAVYTIYYTVGQTAYPKDKVAWSWLTTESRRH